MILVTFRECQQRLIASPVQSRRAAYLLFRSGFGAIIPSSLPEQGS